MPYRPYVLYNTHTYALKKLLLKFEYALKRYVLDRRLFQRHVVNCILFNVLK